MKCRLLVVLAVSTLLWAACGAAKTVSLGDVCGDAGCDACIGSNCPDAGTP
ncbi:MAG: hypothetical protein AB1730_07320 [Myxococcota bacterium]